MDLLMDSHGLSTEQVLRQVSATYSAIIGDLERSTGTFDYAC